MTTSTWARRRMALALAAVLATPLAAQTTRSAAGTAEQATRLQRAVDDAEQKLVDLRSRLERGVDEHEAARQEFTRVDEERSAALAQLDAARQSDDPARVSELEARSGELEQRWKLANERYNLAVEARKTLEQQIALLERTLADERAALARLEQPVDSAPAVPAAATPPSAPAGEVAAPAAAGAPATPGGEAVPPILTNTLPETGEVREARERVAEQQAAAERAAEQVRSVTEQLRQREQLIATERALRENAQKRLENARAAEQTLSDQLRTPDLEPRRRTELLTESSDARERTRAAQREVTAHSTRIEKAQAELFELQSERVRVLEAAEAQRAAAEAAERELEQMTNPFAPHNLWRWMVTRGPRVTLVIVGVIVALVVLRVVARRLMLLMAGRGEEQVARAHTLAAVFQNAAAVAIVVGGGLIVLTEVGVNIVPLMGGVAVIGLAVAFGAQNLIRDFFSGFMILLENQYTIGDVVRIGEHSGQVERITLRVTVLRDLEGVLHFIPNGGISAVRNMTHGWSRVVLDVPVAYGADVDRAMKLMLETANALRGDMTFRQMILENAEMLGVDSLSESAVVLKMIIKTRPLQQWNVKRALLYRIKKRFDEAGIEIPYPQRTVHVRHTGADGFAAAGGD